MLSFQNFHFKEKKQLVVVPFIFYIPKVVLLSPIGPDGKVLYEKRDDNNSK